MGKTNMLLVILILILLIFWCLNISISILDVAAENFMFKNRAQDVLYKHMNQITPEGYTFMIWTLIFGWLLGGLLFLIICMLKNNNDGSGKVLYSPEVFTSAVAGILILNCALHTSWLFVWDNEYLTVASAILFCVTGTNWVALGLFSFNLYENTLALQKSSLTVLNCYRILIQNSLGLYTTWTTIAALINLSIALVDADVADATSSLISLGILTGLLAVWIPLDFFILDKYTRYMITPLFTVIWTLSCIFIRLEKLEQYEDSTPKHFTIGLLGVIATLGIARIVVTVFRAIRFPLK